jgi:hypothetical protein
MPDHVLAAFRRAVQRLRSESGTSALSVWAAESHRDLLDVDATWPLVRDRLDRTEFERSGSLGAP